MHEPRRPLTTPACRSIAAATVDAAVADRLLAALNPTEVALALAAADEVADRRHRVSRAAELAVERARYEAQRAERAFAAVDPENRLVAATLETRWEAKLTALAEAEQAVETACGQLPPLPGRTDIEALTADLPRLWHAETTSNKNRKRLLRNLIADITLLPETDPAMARIGIRWHTGATEELRLARPVHPGTAKRSPSAAVEMVTRLGPTTPTDELADLLNAAGLTTGHGQRFDVKAVQWIRHAYHVPAPTPFSAGEISVADAARFLNCKPGLIYDWIRAGKLAARRGPGNRLCIPWTQAIESESLCRIAESGHLNPAARRTKPRIRT
jgi:hypothetical protein